MSTGIRICQKCQVVMGQEDPSAGCAMLYLDRHDNQQVIHFTLCPNCFEQIDEWVTQVVQRQEAEREAAESKRTVPLVH